MRPMCTHALHPFPSGQNQRQQLRGARANGAAQTQTQAGVPHRQDERYQAQGDLELGRYPGVAAS